MQLTTRIENKISVNETTIFCHFSYQNNPLFIFANCY